MTFLGSRRSKLVLFPLLILAAGASVFACLINQRAHLDAPAPTPILYDRGGAFLAQIGHADKESGRIDYGYWPLEQLPDRVVKATLALEDRRFYEHAGADPYAIGRAAWQNLEGMGRRSGASTIAMQVARMQRPESRTFMHKILEAGTGVLLTLRYGREAMLAQYLRLAPYGNGSHGIAHAARLYFDKPVADLSWAEIALLSAIPQSPTRMNPLRPEGLRRAIQRGHQMLNTLAQQKIINADEAEIAHRQLADMRMPDLPRRPDALHLILRYHDLIENGQVAAASANTPLIHTTIDLALQTDVTALARQYLDGWRSAGAQQVGVMVVSRQTGEVLAQVGSGSYYGRHAGAFDYTRTQRSPGSTLKPFIYALAFERGVLKPTNMLLDLPEGASGIGDADREFLGPMLPRQALANSRNVPATNLLRSIGLETTFRFLRDLGLHDLETPADHFGLSMAIGSLPTRLDRLMRAYGALANDGQLQDLRWAREQPQAQSIRIISLDTARLITSFLSDPQARLPSFHRYGTLEYPFPVAIKTGTSQGYRDAWAMAYSEKVIVGVWIGRGDAGTMSRMTGAGSAARLVHAIIDRVHGNKPGDIADARFPTPPDRKPMEVCVVNGQSNDNTCSQTLVEWLKPDEMPKVAALSFRPDANLKSLPISAAAGRSQSYSLAGADASNPQIHLAISTPARNSQIWRNPEQPAAFDRLPLKADVQPHVPQIVWYVDGQPFAVTDPDRPVFWPIQSGEHRFQIRLPYRDETSAVVPGYVQ
ncbi:transglycosylase domain-containing protein (plasmid) [Rhizobium sp. CB3171]|uniref:transglycosylase domain-containing protein n=1 Tax=Rhizobium sp. CB3171 TaxID=3039157 RepID=UPI0024B1FC23|nr:transglycosylase domain-containing protein [Rhizobium sp. CB3171]WFU04936.1 transglycosylase domain-containing protein [Rhizobium sp. CB3171]